MIVPNKVINFSESIISRIPNILKSLPMDGITIKELYFITHDYFDEIDEFIYALDILFLLDVIKVDFNKGVVTYANKD